MSIRSSLSHRLIIHLNNGPFVFVVVHRSPSIVIVAIHSSVVLLFIAVGHMLYLRYILESIVDLNGLFCSSNVFWLPPLLPLILTTVVHSFPFIIKLQITTTPDFGFRTPSQTDRLPLETTSETTTTIFTGNDFNDNIKLHYIHSTRERSRLFFFCLLLTD